MNYLHVTKSSIDATLSRNSVRSGWEELADDSCAETFLDQAKSSSESSTASSHNNSIISVVNYWIVSRKLKCQRLGDLVSG